MTARPMKESEIQDRVRLVLGQERDAVFWRNNAGVAEMNGHKVRFGVGNPGGADLIGIYKGRFVAVEIKTSTGKQTPEQLLFQQLVERKGGIYRVIRSEIEAQALLQEMRAWR